MTATRRWLSPACSFCWPNLFPACTSPATPPTRAMNRRHNYAAVCGVRVVDACATATQPPVQVKRWHWCETKKIGRVFSRLKGNAEQTEMDVLCVYASRRLYCAMRMMKNLKLDDKSTIRWKTWKTGGCRGGQLAEA